MRNVLKQMNMPFRKNYWSNSAFADWLRGTPKIPKGTSEEWDEWKRRAKSHSPWRFWLAEEGLNKVQHFTNWPGDCLSAIGYYMNNRWVTQTHVLKAHPRDIPLGEWCDAGNRLMPCMFNALVDFIEVELVWNCMVWNKEVRRKYKAPWWAHPRFRLRYWRCPEAGIDHLNWAAGLKYDDDWISPDDPLYGKPTPQAESAQEMLRLYQWWKEERSLSYGFGQDIGWLEQDFHSTDFDKDEEMLIRLIRIRTNMWI